MMRYLIGKLYGKGRRVEELSADVLVAGSGLAGLMAAARAQAMGARVVLLGGGPGASNHVGSFSTALSSVPQDEPAALFNDVLLAGGFLNRPDLVAAVCDRIGRETLFLEGLGVPFHRENGSFVRLQAAGSSWTRAIFAPGMVGVDIRRRLLRRLRAAERAPVVLLQSAFLLDLCVQDGAVLGGLAYAASDRRWLRIEAPAVVLATGGAGQLFGNTTNPPGSQGLGCALALEAGVPLTDMEFISFEPFVMAAPAELRGRDLPTPVLRQGARLRNARGEEFLDTSQLLGKDVICRAMAREVAEGRGTAAGAIHYDIREMPPEMAARYVQLRQVLRKLGIASRDAHLEVAPAQHCVVGGIRIDRRGATEVAGLYAAGEVAGGVHGAHRLATCGGTEAIALGAVAGESAAEYAVASNASLRPWPAGPRPDLLSTGMSAEDRRRLERIRAGLDLGCGIFRNGDGLGESLARLRAVRDELQAEGRLKSFAGRAALVALAIAMAAAARTESRGDHFRTDYPRRDDLRWLGNISARLSRDAADLELGYEQAGISARTGVALGTLPQVPHGS